MLLMAWGGESIGTMEGSLNHEIRRSRREIRMSGVVHRDLRLENMLWNGELGRVLIIDFHRSRLDHRPAAEWARSSKRSLDLQGGRSKRSRLLST